MRICLRNLITSHLAQIYSPELFACLVEWTLSVLLSEALERTSFTGVTAVRIATVIDKKTGIFI